MEARCSSPCRDSRSSDGREQSPHSSRRRLMLLRGRAPATCADADVLTEAAAGLRPATSPPPGTSRHLQALGPGPGSQADASVPQQQFPNLAESVPIWETSKWAGPESSGRGLKAAGGWVTLYIRFARKIKLRLLTTVEEFYLFVALSDPPTLR